MKVGCEEAGHDEKEGNEIGWNHSTESTEYVNPNILLNVISLIIKIIY